MRRATDLCSSRLWTVVLAAGASTRLARPKQLVRLNGRTLLERTVRTADTLTPGRVIVALGAESLRLRRHLQTKRIPLTITVNADWRLGMGGTLSHAIRRMPNDASAALVLLSDQPLIDDSTIQRLIRAWRNRPRRIAASLYGGRAGVPAIFPRGYFRELQRLTGDEGARALLRDEDTVVRVDAPEATVDVDTAEDLAELKLGDGSSRPMRHRRRRGARRALR